jgi:hypothetical protein
VNDATFSSLLVALSASAERIEASVRRVPEDRWDEVIHTGDGAWTRRELLSHMAANDLRQLIRIRVGAGIPEPGDDLALAAEQEVHDWNRARVRERAGREVEELLAEMRANREALVSLLRSLTPEQRERPIPFRGEPTPLQEMIPILIGHLEGHAEELIA